MSLADTDFHQPLTQDGLRLFAVSSRALLGVVWLSSLLFGLYILAHYAAAYSDNDLQRWNDVLPEIYLPGQPSASIGIGIHFAAGGLILLLGGLQLIASIRSRFPVFHRWTGRVYVGLSLFAAIGGLSFIAIRGTVGGPVMNIGFAGYGIAMFVCAIQTMRYAMRRDFSTHQAWAWRLYALAIGSWLYRMDYGLWLALTDWIGHTDDFRGWFDYIMAFFFYVPNLIIVEFMIRSRGKPDNRGLQLTTSVVMIAASGILIFATYTFARVAWLPAIADWLA